MFGGRSRRVGAPAGAAPPSPTTPTQPVPQQPVPQQPVPQQPLPQQPVPTPDHDDDRTDGSWKRKLSAIRPMHVIILVAIITGFLYWKQYWRQQKGAANKPVATAVAKSASKGAPKAETAPQAPDAGERYCASLNEEDGVEWKIYCEQIRPLTLETNKELAAMRAQVKKVEDSNKFLRHLTYAALGGGLVGLVGAALAIWALIRTRKRRPLQPTPGP